MRDYAVIQMGEGEGLRRKAVDELVERRARKRAGVDPVFTDDAAIEARLPGS